MTGAATAVNVMATARMAKQVKNPTHIARSAETEA
jgi:hypothetical protein